MTLKNLHKKIEDTVESLRDYLVSTCRELVRIPSINQPPSGGEYECQRLVAQHLQDSALNPETYYLYDVPGLKGHAGYWPGRDYSNRPNVMARCNGSGGGRSLVLSGHVDTVPLGVMPWRHDPFEGTISDGKLYGLGSYDMKGGMAVILTVMKALRELNLQLKGDIIAESVVDEEFGGVNGTLAGRVRGDNGDGMVIVEPTNLSICYGAMGGRVVHLTIEGKEGISVEREERGDACSRLTDLLSWIDKFRERRQERFTKWNKGKHYPVPLWVTKIYAGGWGTSVPQTIPAEVKVELYWQLLPGEEQDQVDNEFAALLNDMVADRSNDYTEVPKFEYPIRFMPATGIDIDAQVVQRLSSCAERITGIAPDVRILPAPSDMFIVQRDFGIPCVHYGAGGGNAHAADEYVVVEDLAAVAKSLILFAVNWCGLSG